ncbi:hypothetical protein NEOLI_000506 [Neolecta irregularis DAH-3]|uniref:LDB19 N-terminal domain-containing protein n=1 Tax=Neolecta irregularis (strain DAH-3) TaxID=1198029 RepID=A0A1U7LRW0_NEOID|nr:hypothetical protein NEOLI_000506 [Neolecta irregularis DAH-3]|eukprot:OLL25410.1 hypothetical protein NEOLI_000506 [Neolecta irregularis DAH-3]
MLQTQASLSILVESPPLVSYGLPKDSTGALLNGIFRFAVHAPFVFAKEFRLELMSDIRTKRPIKSDCLKCISRKSILYAWNFLPLTTPSRLKMAQGAHDYPFSCLMPGNLAASTDSSLASIEYRLVGTFVPTKGSPIVVSEPITLSRAIIPGNDRIFQRVFPPTPVTARIVIPNTLHPLFRVEMKLTITGLAEEVSTWKLRKIIWRIEELSTVFSPPCPSHSRAASASGVLSEDERTIGSGEIRKGWKPSNNNTYVLETEISTMGDISCDVESSAGISVSHRLIIEAYVLEVKNATGFTGNARILRMQCSIIITNPSGMGIPWDMEIPPT